MPYSEFLFCEDCGELSRLDIDYAGTVEQYIKEGKKDAFVNQATLIWESMVYYCPLCGKRYCYTYRDVERHVREYLAGVSERFRTYFEEKGIDISDVDIQETLAELGPDPSVAGVRKHTAERVQRVYTSKKE
jgi:hypothetical protein